MSRSISSTARRRWIALVALMLVASIAVALSPIAGATGTLDDTFQLTILHHNDGESELLPGEEFGGVDRFRSLVRQLRYEARDDDHPGTAGTIRKRASVLISSGDNFLAGPELNASVEKGIPFFDAIALDLMRYDAFTIGNHEFDFGPDFLEQFIVSFDAYRPDAWRLDPPFISANLDFSGEPGLQELVERGRIAKSHVVTKRGVPIGIVGATTDGLATISSPRNVVVNDLLPAIQDEVDRLTKRGIRIIILSSHLQGIDTDMELVPMLHDVDVVIAGGGDELLANPGDLLRPEDEGEVFGPYPIWVQDADGVQVPIVTGPGEYSYVGRLVTEFNRKGELVAIHAGKSGPQRVSGIAPDAVEPNARIAREVVEPVAAFVASLASDVIGATEVALDGARPGIRTEETNLGNLLTDSLLWQAEQLAAAFGVATPDVALQNGGGIRNNDLRGPGDLTALDTFDIAPFPNFVVVLPGIPRDQFKDILENAYSNVEGVDGRFAHVAGFSVVYDPAGTARDPDDPVTTPGNRVREVSLDDGTMIVMNGAVVPGAALNVATIDFLARGGDDYPYNGAPFTILGASYQQALRNYIVDSLGGLVTAAQYPEGGEGRITTVAP